MMSLRRERSGKGASTILNTAAAAVPAAVSSLAESPEARRQRRTFFGKMQHDLDAVSADEATWSAIMEYLSPKPSSHSDTDDSTSSIDRIHAIEMAKADEKVRRHRSKLKRVAAIRRAAALEKREAIERGKVGLFKKKN